MGIGENFIRLLLNGEIMEDFFWRRKINMCKYLVNKKALPASKQTTPSFDIYLM
jgi:hypothetical protein